MTRLKEEVGAEDSSGIDYQTSGRDSNGSRCLHWPRITWFGNPVAESELYYYHLITAQSTPSEIVAKACRSRANTSPLGLSSLMEEASISAALHAHLTQSHPSTPDGSSTVVRCDKPPGIMLLRRLLASAWPHDLPYRRLQPYQVSLPLTTGVRVKPFDGQSFAPQLEPRHESHDGVSSYRTSTQSKGARRGVLGELGKPVAVTLCLAHHRRMRGHI